LPVLFAVPSNKLGISFADELGTFRDYSASFNLPPLGAVWLKPKTV
jgi:hypothetical protein